MFKKLSAGLIGLVIVAMNAAPAAAQQSGQGLEISPPLIEINVDPGKTAQFTIRLRNITKGNLIAKAQVDDFVAQGETGQPKLLLDKNAELTPYTFKPWVQPITDITIVPQEVKAITVSLAVPKNASPGGHYGVVRFTALPPELEDTGVALSASIGSLVLVKVSGKITEKLSIKEFYASQNGQKKSFFEKGPVTFVERLNNQGSVHLKPTGTLRITNIFGKEVAVLSINAQGGNVLPGTVRRFEQKLDKTNLFGRYSVEANIQYAGKALGSSMTFWVIPYKLIAIILGIAIVVIAAGRQGLKQYKKYIIRQAQGVPKTSKKKK